MKHGFPSFNDEDVEQLQSRISDLNKRIDYLLDILDETSDAITEAECLRDLEYIHSVIKKAVASRETGNAGL